MAHSYGANAALLAAQREPSLVHSLALLEPACFDLARGKPAEETAASLAWPGVRHRTFDGVGHRVQDDPRATAALRDWFSEQR